MQKWFFIANNNIGDTGLSGGDRIFIELARNWSNKVDLTLIGTEEAISVCKQQGLSSLKFLQSSTKLGLGNVFTLGAIFLNFFKKLTNGILFVIKNKRLFKNCNYLYSVSDFYPDLIPAFLIKLINPAAKWVAGFYLFAPFPWQKDSPYKGKDFLRGFLYWLSQKPAHWVVNKYADIVFVTSEPDKKKFITKKRDAKKVIVIRGGVDIKASTDYLNNGNSVLFNNRKYDGCFVGRFHQQKGVLVLIDIWKKVTAKKPLAKLAMVGNGPLEPEVKEKLANLRLNKNIDLFGFIDGEKKFDIFKESKIILHPATFDSGGMAAAEAMAWGLPGVSFNLEALETYYPQGMVKVALGDLEKFSEEIIHLLDDQNYYRKFSFEARDLIVKDWSWDKRADDIFQQVQKEVN